MVPARTADGAGDSADGNSSTDVSLKDDPAVLGPDTVDQANVDPGVPSDTLRIVSREPSRMGRGYGPAGGWECYCHRSLKCLQSTVTGLIFVTVILAIVVWYLKTAQPEPVEPALITASGSCAEPTPRFCERPGCLLRAAETVLFLNRSVDPCSDFYGYACGGYGAAHPTDTLRPIGVRQVLERRNHERLLTLLREEQFFNTSTSSAIAKAKAFFSTCVTSYERGVNKVMALVDLMSRLGGLELFGTWTIKRRKTRATVVYPEETQFDFNDVLSNASLLYPEQALFSVRYDSQLSLLELDLPRLAMGFVDAVARPGTVTHEQLTSRLRTELRVVLAHLEQDSHGGTKPRSCSTNCINYMVEDLLAVQDALAVLRPEPGMEKTSERHMSLSELSELVPQIDWRRMLDEKYGQAVVPDTVTIKVPSSDYMAGIGRLIDDTRYQRLYHFLVWPVIRGYLVALGPVYATLSEHLDHEFALKPLKSREQQCLALLEEHMKPAMRGLFLSAHIGEKNLPFVRDLLKKARGPLADSFTWMSEQSRRASEDLLSSINVDFGDAPWIFGPLDDYFSPLWFNAPASSFFNNLKQLYGFTAPVRIMENPLFDDRPPSSATVRYDVGRQTLTVPYGAMQRPWFDSDVPPSLNAAALGSYVYEAFSVPFFMVHMAVNETYSWDKETLWHLDEFTDCITEVIKLRPISQQYLVPFAKSTTDWTQFDFLHFNTTFATDVMSMLLAREYFSYHLSHRLYNLLAEQEPNVTLPGLHLNSSDQAFYLAYAQARCHNGFPEEETFHEFGDLPRVPQHIAINSLVYSDAGFRRAFQCGDRRPAAGVSRDIGSCRLFEWPTDDDSTTPATIAATEET